MPEPARNLSDTEVEAVIAHYDEIVRGNAETTKTHDVIAEVIADDTGEVVWEVVETAEEMGHDLTDADRDALQDAADAYRARLAAEREAAS